MNEIRGFEGARRGIVLTGGGARGAYQAGVIRGLGEIAAARDGKIPFSIITGASAGAINASFVAATADNFCASSAKLASFWSKLHTRDVFRTDLVSLGRIGFQWAVDVVFGRLKKSKGAKALLDTEPLRRLLPSYVPFERIRTNIDNAVIRAFEVTATDYQTAENISFVMSRDPNAIWQRSRRRSVFAEIGINHVLASAAIPLFFPPIEVDGRHYGDGCLRNPAPLSPAIRLGARKLLIIGVRHPKSLAEIQTGPAMRPTVGRVLSMLLNGILMDAVDFDLERLIRINSTLSALPPEIRDNMPLKPIDLLTIQPSQDLGQYAASQYGRLPDPLQYLIGGLGTRHEASELISYLLFEPAYTGYLAELGRQDVLARRDEIEEFLYGS